MAEDTDAATVREGVGARPKAAEPTDHERYRPIREIARGGMGRVLEAIDTQLQRTVALKEILDEHPDARARFDREVAITARLEHPSIVPLYDAGKTATGAPFYVMRKVAGDPLDVLIRNAASLDQRLRLLPNVLALADAVAHAHARGVIHRDLKPSNVLVGDLGETVVIDWGLAKLIGEPDDDVASQPERAGEALHTRAGTVFGTPGFMPPEQLAGERVDERADVYALGGCLYHVLAGERPTDTLTSFAIAGAPLDLVTIAKKAMAPARADRYLDAGGFSEDLRRFLGGQLVASHHYPIHTRIARWLRRHRALVTVVALATVLAIAGGILSLRRILTEQTRAEDALIREQLRADDLLLFKASSYLETNPTLAAATLQQLREDSPRWPILGPMMAGIRARGVAYSYPGIGAGIRHLELSRLDHRILVSTRGAARIIDPLARTITPVTDDRDVTLASWWRDKVVLHRVSHAHQIFDPATGKLSAAPWPDDVRSVALGDNGGAFFVDRTATASWVDSTGVRSSVTLPEVPRMIRGDPTGTWAAAVTAQHVHLLHASPGHLDLIIAIDVRGARGVAFDRDRRLVISADPPIEYDLTRSPPAEVRRWPSSIGSPYYLGGDVHWWTFADVRRYVDGEPRVISRAHGSDPEAELPDGRSATLVDSRSIVLDHGRQVLRAPDDVDVIAGSPDRRFLVAAGPSRVFVWNFDDLAFASSTLPVFDSVGFLGRDRLIGERPLMDPALHVMEISPALQVTATRKHRLALEVVPQLFQKPDLAIAIDGVRGRATILEPKVLQIGLPELTQLNVLDDTSLIAGTRKGTIHRVEIATGAVGEQLASVGFPVIGLAAHNGWITASGPGGDMWRRDPQGKVTTTMVPKWLTPSLAVDGTVYVGRDRQILSWPPEGEPQVLATFPGPLRVPAILFLDERHLVIATDDGTLHRHDRWFHITTPLLTNARDAAAASSGTIVATSGNDLTIADIKTGTTYRLADQLMLIPHGISISPDGTRVVGVTIFGESHVTANVWRLEPASRAWLMNATNAIAPERADAPTRWRP